MKKLFAVLLASLLVLSLTACGGKSDDSAGSDSAPADLNLEDVYQSLLDQQPKDADELVMLPESSPDILDGFYPGLSDLELKQQVFYAAPVTGFATEVMLVEVADSKDLDTVKESSPSALPTPAMKAAVIPKLRRSGPAARWCRPPGTTRP